MRKIYLWAVITTIASVASMKAQTDVTHLIVNPDFEETINTGWANVGLGPQGNNEFTMKHGDTYIETWTGWGGTVGDRSIKQTISNVPLGVYTLTAGAHNIQQERPNEKQTGAYIHINDRRTEVNLPGEYSVTATVGDGTLVLGAYTQGATGNWVCFDNFRLTYTIVADSLQPYVQAIIDEAYAIDQHLTDDKQTELEAARTEMETYLGTQKTEGITEAMQRLRAAIRAYQLASATPENPIDMTYAIVNPSFETDGSKGWDTDMSHQGNDVFNVKEGNYYMERWTWWGGAVDYGHVSQVVTGLPEGSYRLTCVAQNIQEERPSTKYTGAWVYAGNEQTEVNVRGKYQVDFTCVAGEVEIGFRAEGAKGNWISVDDFRLQYLGYSEEGSKAMLEQYIQAAEQLVNEKMHADTLAALNQSIAEAKALTEYKNVQAIALAIQKAIEQAQSSIAAYKSLAEALEVARQATGTEGAEEFNKTLAEAQAVYDATDSDNATLAQMVEELERALFVFHIVNGEGTKPSVTTHPEVIYGCKAAVGRLKATGLRIIEKGFCWSESPEPTVLDNKSETVYEFNGDIYLMDNLKPATTYYVRAYAITKTYAVGYGDVVRIITLPEADVQYSYNWAGDAETNERLYNACETATYYLNTWTAIRGYRPSVNYDAGDDGAHGSYGGWITVGAYFAQNPGTVMHEMGHGIGVGQHWRYTSWDSPLHPTMYWEGERANRVFYFFENSTAVKSDGDRVHVCYGLSGVTAPIDLLRQAAYYQGLYEDGMPAVGDGACPFYSFDCEEGTKYYLTSEKVGTAERFVCENETGGLSNKAMTADELLMDDAYAWYVTYQPTTGLYYIKNAKTGKYFTLGETTYGMKEVTEPTRDQDIHLMPSRQNATIKVGELEMTVKPYWLARGDRTETPRVLNALNGNYGDFNYPGLNFADSGTSQRWIFLSESQVEEIRIAADIEDVRDERHSAIESYYDITGKRINSPNNSGITIVRYTDGRIEKRLADR